MIPSLMLAQIREFSVCNARSSSLTRRLSESTCAYILESGLTDAANAANASHIGMT